MPQKRREAFVAAKEAPAALSALEQLVAEAAAAEAGAARTAKREALAAVQAEGRAFRAARSGARRALGRLRADRRGGDDAVGRALAAVDPVGLLSSWAAFCRAAPENHDVEAPRVARRCRAKWRRFAAPEAAFSDRGWRCWARTASRNRGALVAAAPGAPPALDAVSLDLEKWAPRRGDGSPAVATADGGAAVASAQRSATSASGRGPLLVAWAVEDAAVPETTARRRRPRAAELPPYEAPLLELLRAEHGALVLRWDPRWERRGGDADGGDRRTWADDRAERGRVKLARLGVARSAPSSCAHGLGAYAEAFAALKVDGAVLQRAMSVGDVEALGVARAGALRLRDVLATLRADGVAEKAICRAYAARRDARVVLERTKAVAGAAVVLELFRGGASAEADAGAWDVVHSGPGGGCRVAGLAPATRYRFRVSVVHGGKQISKFGNVALATTGPPPPPPRLSAWFKTPPDRSRVRDPTGGGWSERTVELLLDGAPPSRDAVFVVLMRDDDDPAGAWVRCHRGRTPRVRASSLVAGRTYAFKAAFAVAERDATPFSEPLRVTAPGALPPGGATVGAPRRWTTAPPARRRSGTGGESVGGGAWRVAWSDDKQRPYYHNVTSGLSQWTPPLRAWE
ncbi:3-oxo-behenoyl-CoA reductase [Aureococcus anophagefferens]|nr:3-oxo-behenoyl-CoA reductase [Aureococcus anophagefferens]